MGSSVRPDLAKDREDFLAQNGEVLATANEVGFNQIVISDWRLATTTIAKREGGLIGKDKPFANEAELDAHVANCIAMYKDIPGINAFNIGDEPGWNQLESFGQLYQSIGRVWPEAERFYNFFPLGLNTSFELTIGPVVQKDGQTLAEAAIEQYENYLNTALDYMGDVTYLRFDAYPLRANSVLAEYIPALQVAAKICKQRGIELQIYTQSCEILNMGNPHIRKVDARGAQWLNNTILGFGARAIGYFTYVTNSSSNSSGETFIDGSSFLTHKHKKTELYDIMQKIMADNQKFANVLFNFSYCGSRTYISDEPSKYSTLHASLADNSHVLKRVEDLKIDKGCALVTELYDPENRYFMYMVMNLLDPIAKGSPAYQTTTVTFSEQFTHVLTYKNNSAVPVIQELDKNHQLVIEQTAGEAMFVIPY
jgi:hypothetical protein